MAPMVAATTATAIPGAEVDAELAGIPLMTRFRG